MRRLTILFGVFSLSGAVAPLEAQRPAGGMMGMGARRGYDGEGRHRRANVA